MVFKNTSRRVKRKTKNKTTTTVAYRGQQRLSLKQSHREDIDVKPGKTNKKRFVWAWNLRHKLRFASLI
jgi:hypothetical protein